MFTNEAVETVVIDNITYWKRKRGTPDVHLARAADISTRTFSRYMRRDGTFTLRQLIAIADTLGVDLRTLASERAIGSDAA